MGEWSSLGKLFIAIGAIIAVLGGTLLLGDRVSGLGHLLSWLGKLPGDISIKRDNFTLYVPLATSVVLSVLLSLVFYLLSWMFRR